MTRITRPRALAATVLLALAAPLLAGAALAVPAAAAPADGEVTWSVEPAPTNAGRREAFEYSVDPGTQIVDSVIVTNRGTTPADFVIYATDAINDIDTGSFGLLESDQEPADVGAWISTASEAITLQPGTEASIPFTLVVPSDATPGDHVAGIVAAVLTEGEQDGAAIALEQRVGARVYLEVSGARVPEIEVGAATAGFAASWNPFAPGDLDVAYTLTNTGNTRVDVTQAITVTGPFGIPLAEVAPEPVSELLPRQVVRVKAEVPAILALFLTWATVTATPGPVGSAALVEDGDDDTASTATPTPTATADADSAAVTDETVIGELEFEPATGSAVALSISWTLLLLVVGAILILVLIVRYVSGTRERMYLAIDEAAAAAREEALADRDAEEGK